jgi:hypothetical protein
MASLSTVYVISLILASMSAMGATLAGNRFIPPKTVESAESPQSIEQTELPVSEEGPPDSEE